MSLHTTQGASPDNVTEQEDAPEPREEAQNEEFDDDEDHLIRGYN